MSTNLSFLVEVRKRVLFVLAIWGAFAAICLSFANKIYEKLAYPMLHQLAGHHAHLIATGITAPFFVPMQSALVLSLYLVVPFALFEFWRFVSPALYKKEKQPIRLLLFFSVLLFYGGTLFSYEFVLPVMFRFFSGFSPVGVTYSPDISAYLDFISGVFLSFGVVFLLPIIVVGLNWLGIVDRDKLANKRPYVIVGCFVVGMLLTPPDVVSQCSMALPMWALFEMGLLLCYWIGKRKKTV